MPDNVYLATPIFVTLQYCIMPNYHYFMVEIFCFTIKILLLILEIFNLNCFSYMTNIIIQRGHACRNMPGAYSVYKFCDGYIQGQADSSC